MEVLPAQGGAQAIPALINGDIDFAIGQPFGPFRADLQDLGVMIIGNYAVVYADGDDINAVVASKKSGITQPARARRAQVSVNSLGAAGDVTIMAAVEKDGGDPRRSSSSRSPSPTCRPSSRRATSTPPGCPTLRDATRGRGDTVVVEPYQATFPGLPPCDITTQS